MKKSISYLITFLLASLAVSCTGITPKEDEGASAAKMKGMFYAGVEGASDVIEIMPGKSKTLDLRAYADKENGGVSDIVLTMTFKGDPDAVAAYNSANGTECQALPGSAYEFTVNEVTMPRYGTASTTAKLKLSTFGLEDGITYLLPVVIDKVAETDNWEASPKVAYVLVKLGYVAPNAGTGTADDPYNIYSLADLTSMGEKLEEGVKVYFRMQADIDMDGVSWIPLNFASPYKLMVDFDGNGHTISNFHCEAPNYPSFFGVLYGKCHDVTFLNASIVNSSTSCCGVVGAYCGTTGLPGECRNVHVEGEVTCDGNVRGVGGLFGRVNEGTITDSSFKGKVTQAGGATGTGGIAGWINGTIERCWVDAEVTSNANYCGGLFGYDNAMSVVKDCWTAGTVTNGQRAGGIAGGLLKEKTQLINCYSVAMVTSPFCIGGIAGHCNLDKGSGVLPNTTVAEYVIEKCIAWNEGVIATGSDDAEHYSSGAIAGYISCGSFLTDCYRKADLNFQECTSASAFVPFDQPNASPSAPLAKPDGSGTYIFPYHGRAAAAGITLSALAKSIGWSELVWDFSGSLPTLKAAAGGGSDPGDDEQDVNAGGQLPDFDESDVY